MKYYFVFFLILTKSVTSLAQQPAMREIDRIRIAEAYAISQQLDEAIWPGWNAAPFAILLVTPEHEFLIRHPRPPTGFDAAGHDALLASDIHVRKRTFPLHLLATMGYGGIPTVVIGQAENTYKKTSAPWVVTLLHEHLHQLQQSQPDYHAAIDALALDGGDKTGMWMLNFPMPYAEPAFQSKFDATAAQLLRALQAADLAALKRETDAYLLARTSLLAMLSPAERRYFALQVWQEGYANYTETRIAQLLSSDYTPSPAFRQLADYQPFSALATMLSAAVLRQLGRLDSASRQREAFYPFGAGEAMLLDRIRPEWRSRYLRDKLDTATYFQ
ncbi:MAG TPA: hypothetical protein VIT92_09060 [Burkholderiaceae bacterium]